MTDESDHPVADAAVELRRLREELLPAEAEQVDAEIRQAIEAVSGAIEQAAIGDMTAEMRRMAHETRLQGTRMTAAREDAFSAVARVLGEEIAGLEELLRPADAGSAGSVSSTDLADPSAPDEAEPDAGIEDAGPSVPPELAAVDLDLAAEDAARLPAPPRKDQPAGRRPINQVVARFIPKLQALARALFFGRSSHAVQRHGHQLTLAEQLARVQWLRDPAAVDEWQLEHDGRVISRRHKDGKPHQVGTKTTNYTSPEAVARPLAAILDAAGRTQGQLDAYLDGKAKGKQFLKLFLHPDDTGITPKDVYTLRAPGTDTKDGKKMWTTAREGALDGLGAAPTVREYDLATDGRRPGSLVIFVKGKDSHWQLVTSYFDDQPLWTKYTEL